LVQVIIIVPVGLLKAIKYHLLSSTVLGLGQSIGFLVLLFRLRAVLGTGESASTRQKLRAITLVASLGSACWCVWVCCFAR
jgi:hypothetical protein